ncbi:MAG: TOBE domain-containing protein, partial [Elstera sp.]
GSPKMNFLIIRTVTPQGDALLLALPGAGAVALPRRGEGAPAVLGVRPEHLTIVAADAPDALHGTVLVTEALGSETLLHIDLAGQTIIVKQEGTAPFSRGDTVALCVPKDACHLFDANGLALAF